MPKSFHLVEWKSTSSQDAGFRLLCFWGCDCRHGPVAQRPNHRSNDSFRPRDRHLLYVALPGSLERPGWLNGVGIVVLDPDDGYRFVKRIPTWNYAASMSPEQVSGIAASPVTNLIYVAARGRLGAIDLATDKMVWSVTLDGQCCERPQVTPDGKIVVVGGDLQDYWYEVDGTTGKLIGILHAPESQNSHNLNLSADGKTAFMSPNNKVMTVSDVRRARSSGPSASRTISASSCSTRTRRGSMPTTTISWAIALPTSRPARSSRPSKSPACLGGRSGLRIRARIPHGCPSHGIAITPDGKEIWVDDGIFNKIHIFSNTDHPREIDTIDSTAGTFWMTFGLDGKYAFASSGDIIDIRLTRSSARCVTSTDIRCTARSCSI